MLIREQWFLVRESNVFSDSISRSKKSIKKFQGKRRDEFLLSLENIEKLAKGLDVLEDFYQSKKYDHCKDLMKLLECRIELKVAQDLMDLEEEHSKELRKQLVLKKEYEKELQEKLLALISGMTDAA